MLSQAKRRKIATAIEEITFDPANRHEYLTGFHKRKLQRTKQAQEIAEKKAREEKRQERKRIREERALEYQRIVEKNQSRIPETSDRTDSESASNSEAEANEDWQAFEEPAAIDYEAEYIDEDKYTTVTVEEIDPSKERVREYTQKDVNEDDSNEENSKQLGKTVTCSGSSSRSGIHMQKLKRKRKNFHYESKEERKVSQLKQRLAKRRKANARKER
ncbi:Nucleolar protein 12 (25kDa) domain containing protein [Elaphomyces granulatus]|jgi:ribosomal RNA-processing protein 17